MREDQAESVSPSICGTQESASIVASGLRNLWRHGSAWTKAIAEVAVPLVLSVVVRSVRRRYASQAGSAVTRILSPKIRTNLAPARMADTMPKAGVWRGQQIIIAHDAHDAKLHADLYLSNGETAWNVGVKKLPDLGLKINAAGQLTQASKGRVLSVLRQELENKGYLAQSTTHSHEAAESVWACPEEGPLRGAYGSGPFRLLVSKQDVVVKSDGMKAGWVNPDLDPHKSVYAYKIMSRGPLRSKNILSVGFKKPQVPVFADRLHLKYVPDRQKFIERVAGGQLTQKVDGAATHWRTDSHGLRAWSPRIGVETGERIAYTPALGALAAIQTPEPTQGMAELVFVHPGAAWRPWYRALGCLELADRLGIGVETTFSETSGILNSHALPPPGLTPRLYIYRVDSQGRTNLMAEPAEVNRLRCLDIARLSPDMRVPRALKPSDLKDLRGEGAVGVPPGGNLSDNGVKWKIHGDEMDWLCTDIEFARGPNSGISGVARYTSLESGRRFNLGASAIGTRETAEDMMARPRAYIGRVVKTQSLAGHEGRASRVLPGLHTDK